MTETLSSRLGQLRPLRRNGALANRDLENFSVYGFSIDYPKDCRVEFNPKSRREEGDVVFHFPSKDKVFLSWGDLEKATKRFKTVEQHAEHSLEKVRKGSNVKGFERTLQGSLTVNSHTGAYNRVRFQEVTVGFFTGKKTLPREAYSVHLHCTNSSRYFVIYALVPKGAAEEYEKALMAMVHSLRCH
jgi:hypothetical protein